MRSFLTRISSRKFLASLLVQLAGVAALFWPAKEETLTSAAVRIAALLAMLLAALGYGTIEASVDRASGESQEEAASPPVDRSVQIKSY